MRGMLQGRKGMFDCLEMWEFEERMKILCLYMWESLNRLRSTHEGLVSNFSKSGLYSEGNETSLTAVNRCRTWSHFVLGRNILSVLWRMVCVLVRVHLGKQSYDFMGFKFCCRKSGLHKGGRTREEKIWKREICVEIWEAKHTQLPGKTWRSCSWKGLWKVVTSVWLLPLGSMDKNLMGVELGRWAGHSTLFYFFFCP